jgi:hypothetical protein
VATYGMLDAQAQEQLIVVVQSTYEVQSDGSCVPVEPMEISPTDRHHGAPGCSSVRYPGQMSLHKPKVDLLVTGHAVAPGGRPTTQVVIGVRTRSVHKVLRVVGDRFLRPGVGGRVPSSPKPFERMPVVYERAFGGGMTAQGTARSAFEPYNPVGVGLGNARSANESIETELPNIEYSDGRRSPAGLGPIGPAWQPRIGYAGTYDANWLQDQAPLLPFDFDTRFFQVAPEDQQLDALAPGDWIEVTGMRADGTWLVRLPAFEAPLTLAYVDRITDAVPRVDTVHLEPDLKRIHLTSRHVLQVELGRAPLVQAMVGRMSPAWRRAWLRGKVFRISKGRA